MRQLIDKKNKIIIYLIFLLVLSTTSNKTLKIQKKYSSNVIKINVSGLSSLHNLKIVNLLNDMTYKNIFFISSKEIDKIIYTDTSIERYYVKKIYPSKLNIEIKPAKFIAKISSQDYLFVGSNGKLINSKTVKKVLPLLSGEFNSEEFIEFKKIIDKSKFNFLDLKSIIFYPSKRWNILTTNDILIKLPERNLLESLKVATKIINDYRFKENKVIDLRISRNIIMQNE
jgi:cell division protein FtsQ